MRRIIAVFLFLLAGLGVYAQSGLIRELSGTVEVKPEGSSSYVPARAGDSIRQDTIISTGFRSTALIEVGSSVLTVRPLTRLTLTAISASSGVETLNVNLRAGRVRVDVNPPAGTRAATAVTSPIATASVRGTSFEFDTRNLSVNQGTVSFLGNNGSQVLVRAGSVSLVGANGKAEDPIEIRVATLVPPPPAGISDPVSGGGNSAAAPVNGIININLEYAGTEAP